MPLDIDSDANFRNQFKDALNNGGVFDVEILFRWLRRCSFFNRNPVLSRLPLPLPCFLAGDIITAGKNKGEGTIMEKRIILLLLYCISLIGIGGKLFFDVRALGIVGYAALCIAGIMQIIKTVGKK